MIACNNGMIYDAYQHGYHIHLSGSLRDENKTQNNSNLCRKSVNQLATNEQHLILLHGPQTRNDNGSRQQPHDAHPIAYDAHGGQQMTLALYRVSCALYRVVHPSCVHSS